MITLILYAESTLQNKQIKMKSFPYWKRIQVKPITTKMYEVNLLCSKVFTTANFF